MFNSDFFNKDISEYTTDDISLMVETLKRIYTEVPEYYTYESILKRMLAEIPDDMDKRPGSIIYDALAPCAGELANEYIEIQIYKDQTYLLTATGDNLDKKGADFAIPREEATQAERIGELIDLNDNLINLPINSRFSVPDSDSTITYYIKSFKETGKPILVCEQSGTIGNEYSGALLPLFSINNLKEAKIVGTQTPAQDREDDDTYRIRIISKLSSKGFGGNIQDYKDYIESIPGTSEPKVYPAWDGGGTVKCSVLDSQYNAITDEFKEQIKELIDPEEYTGQGVGMAPIGHVVTIDTPTKKTINIQAKVYLDGVSIGQIQTLVEKNLEEYMLSIRKEWVKLKKTSVFISQITSAMVQVQGIINVTDILLNNQESDIVLENTAQEQFIPILGTVTLIEAEEMR